MIEIKPIPIKISTTAKYIQITADKYDYNTYTTFKVDLYNYKNKLIKKLEVNIESSKINDLIFEKIKNNIE